MWYFPNFKYSMLQEPCPIKFKTMKTFYSLLLSLFISLFFQIAAAQNLSCGTGDAPPATLAFLEQLHSKGLFEARVAEDVLFVPIKIHIIRNDAGVSAFQLSDALRNICELNDWFAPSGIQFFMRGDPNYINNTAWATNFQNGDNDIINPIHNVSGVVNVYYVNVTTIGLCGFANFPGTGSPQQTTRQGAIYLAPSCSAPGNSTFAHEMGHYLSLPHPFQTTSTDPTGPLAERVTRNNNEQQPRLSANCISAGDRFCDTPADYIDSRWSCPRTHTQVDINGDLFQPDEKLIMGYANDNCHEYFSPQQIAAMRATLTVVNGVSGPRRYLMAPPMPAYDTITQVANPIEPTNNATGIPQRWAYFRWNAVPGATQYILRLRFNFNTLEEILVSDTSFLYTGNRLNANINYRWSVAAINHKLVCINWSAENTFTTTATGVGIAENSLDALHVYPNPLAVGEVLQFETGALSGQPIEGWLVDLKGSVLEKFSLPLDGSGVSNWQAAAHAPGIYLLRLRHNGQEKHLRLIMKP